MCHVLGEISMEIYSEWKWEKLEHGEGTFSIDGTQILRWGEVVTMQWSVFCEFFESVFRMQRWLHLGFWKAEGNRAITLVLWRLPQIYGNLWFFPRKFWVMEIFPGILFPWTTLKRNYFSQIKQNVNCTLISSCQMSNCKGNKELDMHQSSVKLKKFSNSEIPRLLMMGSHLDNKFSWEFHRVISNDNDNWYILWYHDAIKDWSELICKTIGSNLLNVIQILLKR